MDLRWKTTLLYLSTMAFTALAFHGFTLSG